MRPSLGMGYRIKIGVGGRFHSDRLAEALLQRGWDVSLVTSFPKNRFKSIPPAIIETAMHLEAIYRMAAKLGFNWANDFKLINFGKRFSRACKAVEPLDVVLAWSGFAIEAFRGNPESFKVLVRDSTHILEQVDILQKEYTSLGLPFPDHQTIIRRELEEYQLADKIIILSNVAKSSFLKHGVPESKLSIIRLGADLSIFSSGKRNESLLKPLRVVYFGTIGVRKGILYLLKAVESFSQAELNLTCIGSIEPELKTSLQKYPAVSFLPPLSHKELAKKLREFDVFVMPSLEDGFGLVIPQAMAAGLVPIVSTAAGGSELISHRQSGFLVPPRDPIAITRCLKELLDVPHLLSEMRKVLLEEKTSLSWDTYGKDFDTVLRAGIES